MRLLASDTIRRCFIADPGKVIFSADFDQIELRIIAALAGEQVMIDAAKRGDSLHKTTAVRMFGEKYTPDQYRYSKNLNFGWAFGGGAATLAEQTGLPVPECAALIRTFEDSFPALREFKRRETQKILNEALPPEALKQYRALRAETYHLRDDTPAGRKAKKVIQSRIDALLRGKLGHVTTAYGRRLPVDAAKAYTAINYQVQSTARDIMAEALLRVMDNTTLSQTVLLVIHDEILGQDYATVAEQTAELYGRLMSTTFRGVPITASGEVYGKSWGHGYAKA